MVYEDFILKGMEIQDIEIEDYVYNKTEKEVVITIRGTRRNHSCPRCGLEKVILKGNDGYREVRHLDMFGNKCLLKVLRVRLICKECGATFAMKSL